jgi:hypothetical protein
MTRVSVPSLILHVLCRRLRRLEAQAMPATRPTATRWYFCLPILGTRPLRPSTRLRTVTLRYSSQA